MNRTEFWLYVISCRAYEFSSMQMVSEEILQIASEMASSEELSFPPADARRFTSLRSLPSAVAYQGAL